MQCSTCTCPPCTQAITTITSSSSSSTTTHSIPSLQCSIMCTIISTGLCNLSRWDPHSINYSICTPTSTNISTKCFVGCLNIFLCKPTPQSPCRNSNLQMWLSFCSNGPCSTSTSTSSKEWPPQVGPSGTAIPTPPKCLVALHQRASCRLGAQVRMQPRSPRALSSSSSWRR
mmetsp:Transcript_4408/g.7767  ORF Transcript_4408/g.7767 Transcript_4408/m.7767 type:complete len:172 (-) Transcript_4408:1401-1916(-)